MNCTVYRIRKIQKHPRNENLYLAQVGPYEIITGREPDGSCHYYEGQLGFFIPAGAIVPDKLAEEMYVLGKLAGKKKNRVKASERDGERSEGLFYGSQGASWNPLWKEGDDVTNEVGVIFP